MNPVNRSNLSQIYYSFKDSLVKNKTIAAIVLLSTAIFTVYLISRNYKISKIPQKKLIQKPIGNRVGNNESVVQLKKTQDKSTASSFFEKITGYTMVKKVNYEKDPVLKETDFTIIQKIFKETDFECSELPTYPEQVEESELPKFEKMDAPIMKGKTAHAVPFIAFKLQCTVKEEYVDKLCQDKSEEYTNSIKQEYLINKKVDSIFILNSKMHQQSKNCWEQFLPDDHNACLRPVFFKGILSLKSEEKNLKSFNEFIIKKEGKDLNGVHWKLCE